MFTEEEIEEIRKHDESQTNCELVRLSNLLRCSRKLTWLRQLKLSSEEAWYLSFESVSSISLIPCFSMSHPSMTFMHRNMMTMESLTPSYMYIPKSKI
jgi:hypothetical protein